MSTMAQTVYLADTNVVSELVKKSPSALVTRVRQLKAPDAPSFQ